MNILIFGATSAIGKELARLYINDGHRVIITGRRLDFVAHNTFVAVVENVISQKLLV